MGAKQQAFIEKLHELFQINNGLDFGIYRIINEKKSDIENYINNTLPNKINKFLEDLKTVSVDNTAKINELEIKIKTLEELGGNADAVKKIEDIKREISQLQQASLSGNIEEEIYDKLLTFFSRYYDEGDFISQRRYKDGVYAVPYRGEEVKLHWANHDQYYIKTSENFKDYTFNIEDDFNVTFILTDAEIERDNNKSDDKKVYVLAEPSEEYEKPVYVLENEEKTRAELFIRLSYRYGKDIKQKESSEAIINAVKQLENVSPDVISEIGGYIFSRLKEVASRCENIADFIHEVSLLKESDLLDERADRISLMTLHASKGLEFNCVFIVGLEDGIIPFSRSQSPSEQEEERRLLYVGMTRAKQRLYLCRAQKRTIFGKTENQKISPFLAKIERDLIELSKFEKEYKHQENMNQLSLF